MKQEDIEVVVELMDLGPTSVKSGWVMVSCPFAPETHDDGADANPSFGISIWSHKESFYNCLACGRKGPLAKLPTNLIFARLTDGTFEEARAYISAHEIFGSEDSDDAEDGYLVDLAPNISERVFDRWKPARKKHFDARGITVATARSNELCFDVEENRLVFPIRDGDGRLVGFRGRYLGDNPENPKYKEYTDLSPSGRSVKSFGVWYGLNVPHNPAKMVFLVEGEIDCLLLKQRFPTSNVIASLSATITKRQMSVLQTFAKGIVLFFDNDKSGRDASYRIIRKHRDVVPIARVYDYAGCKDPAEMVQEGVIEQAIRSVRMIPNAS